MQTSWHGHLPLERSLTVFGRSAQDVQACQTTATIAARPTKGWMNDWHKNRRGKEKKEKKIGRGREVNTDRYWLNGNLPSPHVRVRS